MNLYINAVVWGITWPWLNYYNAYYPKMHCLVLHPVLFYGKTGTKKMKKKTRCFQYAIAWGKSYSSAQKLYGGIGHFKIVKLDVSFEVWSRVHSAGIFLYGLYLETKCNVFFLLGCILIWTKMLIKRKS